MEEATVKTAIFTQSLRKRDAKDADEAFSLCACGGQSAKSDEPINQATLS